MISDAGVAGRRSRPPSALSWWLAFGLSLLWRLPVLLLCVLLIAWFGFSGLAHLPFLFVENQLLTFIFAPALLPFAAAPALCFVAVLRLLPALWRRGTLTAGQRLLVAGGAPLLALMVAQFLDLLQINLLKMVGIAPPCLPFAPC
jgi:hypothetical protein